MKTRNIFIATLPRSGSTLLGMMLGAHSQVCHIGESAYWSKIDVSNSKCCCGTTGCTELIKMSEIASAYPTEIAAISDACGLIDLVEEPNKVRHHMSHSVQTMNHEFLEQTILLCCNGLERVADAARIVFGKEVIVENSKYLPIAEKLLERDSNWKVIAMIRDPRGIALSSREAGKRKGVPRPVKDKVELFLSFSRRISEMARHRNVLLIRYEDLCTNTTGTIENICAFLDITFEQRMMEFKTHKGHLLMGNHMMHDQNQEVHQDLRWHELLSSEEKWLFVRDDLIEAYAQFGYNLETGL